MLFLFYLTWGSVNNKCFDLDCMRLDGLLCANEDAGVRCGGSVGQEPAAQRPPAPLDVVPALARVQKEHRQPTRSALPGKDHGAAQGALQVPHGVVTVSPKKSNRFPNGFSTIVPSTFT